MRSQIFVDLASVAIAVTSSMVCAEQMQCEAADGGNAKRIESAFNIPAGHLANLYRAYTGIAHAAETSPPLYICLTSIPNAMAQDDEDYGSAVIVTTGMIQLLDGDVDELAAVLGHEFGHLLHGHRQKKQDLYQKSTTEVVRDAQQRLNHGATMKTVVEIAQQARLSTVTAFSRAAEREADDEGFSLMRIAGFDKSGARRAAEKGRSVSGGAQAGWFATHPGWDERVGYSARLETNETFREEAEKSLNAGQLRALQITIQNWVRLVPDSGAASFYRGMYLSRSNESKARVSEAFEDSVSYFDGEGLSRAAQSYQDEGNVATIALCVSLFRENRKSESLQCLKLLDSNEEVELFRQITGWRDFIFVGRYPRIGWGSIYAARSDKGEVEITNCAYIADREGLKGVREWKGMREAKAPTSKGADAMICSRDFCDCRPIDFARAFPNLLK